MSRAARVLGGQPGDQLVALALEVGRHPLQLYPGHLEQAERQHAAQRIVHREARSLNPRLERHGLP